jgi:hypothetical protein
MTHYVMDCYATAATDFCESFPINAGTDAQAIWEAKSAAIWRKPAYFQLREVMRHGDRAVHDSRKNG